MGVNTPLCVSNKLTYLSWVHSKGFPHLKKSNYTLRVVSASQCAHCFNGLNHRNKCKPKSFGLTPNGFSALKISWTVVLCTMGPNGATGTYKKVTGNTLLFKFNCTGS